MLQSINMIIMVHYLRKYITPIVGYEFLYSYKTLSLLL